MAIADKITVVLDLDTEKFRDAINRVARDSISASINRAVDRFLGWPLPVDFAPDGSVSIDRTNSLDPIGTNLFTAAQARAMFLYAFDLTDEIQGDQS